MIFWIIIIIINMNKARGQKKDVTRILKAMKLEASATRYHETINQDNFNSIERKETKPYAQKLIYASNNKKNDVSANTKKRKYRYDRNTIENQNYLSLGYRQHRSLDVRKDNFLRISQKLDQTETLNVRNPYQTRNKFSSVVKPLRRSSNQPRRIITQQSTRPEPIRRSFHFKTLQSHQPLNIAALIEEAKLLSTNGSISESDLIVQRILREDPENKEALYLSGCNNYKQMNYLRCLTALNMLLEADPVYNKNAYIMSSVCFNNKGQKEEAMLRINTCLSYFPDFYEAHFQKAKLFLKAEDMKNAIKSLKKALRLAKEPYQCCLKLGQCYQRQQMYDLALKLYEKISKQATSTPKETQQRAQCLLKKAQCEKKLQKYKESILTLQNYLKTVQNNTLINISKILYQIGYACFKIGDYPNASMYLEEVFTEKSKKESTDALILLTLINIKKRDFYEAYHCLLRKEHLEINQEQLEFYEKFCEGVLCLMKRKFQIGLQKLIQIESQVSEIVKDEFRSQIAIIYPLYLSYSYFCFGRTDKCIKINRKLLEENSPELLPHRKGIEFNLALCQGIEEYKHKKLGAAKFQFQKSNEIYPHKPEGHLYLAITLIQLYLKDYNENLLKRAKAVLTTCINNLKELNNNYSASVFYVKAVLSASMGQWDNAINQIDESIERAEDNDAKAFYLRSLILACCQNYKQAVSEASIAISLNNKEPAYYLLRSKCEQIEGDGNKAFLDLQEYIALCPDDSEIHKFAGHLLFQNGAFEDALQAYDNGEISADVSNYDVFLTRGKTYFLLGQFQKCATDMQVALKLKPNDPSISFDICVIKILHDFFQDNQSNLWTEKAQKAKQELENLAAVGEDIDYGRIFKKIQISMLLSLFLFYLGMYKEAARQFKETITMKQATFVGNQSQFEQELKEKQFFVAQMYYNRAMCYLMLSEPAAAVKALENCKIEPESKTQGRLEDLIKVLKGKKEGKSEVLEVFSQKNKMSRVLNEVAIKLNNNDIIKLKLSIPFPKVEPPDINPKFQIRILRQIDIEGIERKPEAPWILREQNSIKFTQKIEQFSRLEINNSELSKADNKNSKPMCTEEEEFASQYDGSFQSLQELKQKLKLDDQIETKLNKILNKKK